VRVLLVEDDASTALTIQSVLQNGDNICDITHNGEDALQVAKIYPYDAMILDLGLPDRDGKEVLRKFRELNIQVPVLILSGNQDIKTKVSALGIGADDYMIKPFHQQELLARLKAIIRRADGHSSSKIAVGDLAIDLERGVLSCQSKPLRLTSTEYKIMEAFMLKPGATLTKQFLMDRLYGGIDEPEMKIVDVFICKLRAKLYRILGPNGPRYIETVWGRGYTLVVPYKGANQDGKGDAGASEEAFSHDAMGIAAESGLTAVVS
jgi:two-component system, cell cycle response regulator CtrA